MSAAQVASQPGTYDAQRLDLGSALKWYVKQQLRVIFVALKWDIRWIQPFIPCPEDTLGRVFRRLIHTPHLRSSMRDIFPAADQLSAWQECIRILETSLLVQVPTMSMFAASALHAAGRCACAGSMPARSWPLHSHDHVHSTLQTMAACFCSRCQ